MKNVISTIFIFGVIFLVIVIGAYIFDKFNGFGLIEQIDMSINNTIQSILDDKKHIEDNITNNNHSDVELMDNNSHGIANRVAIGNLIDNNSKM